MQIAPTWHHITSSIVNCIPCTCLVNSQIPSQMYAGIHVRYLTWIGFNQTWIRTRDFSEYPQHHTSRQSGQWEGERQRQTWSQESLSVISLLTPLATVSRDRLFCTHKPCFCAPFRFRQFPLRTLSPQHSGSVHLQQVSLWTAVTCNNRKYLIWRLKLIFLALYRVSQEERT
jgi:hypothetical protein